MYAIKDALEGDPKKRLGSTWESFTQHEFFSVSYTHLTLPTTERV